MNSSTSFLLTTSTIWIAMLYGRSSNQLQGKHILCFSIPLHFKPLLQIVVGLFDFLNMHRGSLFFLIFVCKKSILDQVKLRRRNIMSFVQLREKVFGSREDLVPVEMTRNPTLAESQRQISTASRRCFQKRLRGIKLMKIFKS